MKEKRSFSWYIRNVVLYALGIVMIAQQVPVMGTAEGLPEQPPGVESQMEDGGEALSLDEDGIISGMSDTDEPDDSGDTGEPDNPEVPDKFGDPYGLDEPEALDEPDTTTDPADIDDTIDSDDLHDAVTSITGTIAVLGLPSFHPSVLQLTLYRDGQADTTYSPAFTQIETTIEMTSWQYSFPQLPARTDSGENCHYTLSIDAPSLQDKLYTITNQEIVGIGTGVPFAPVDLLCAPDDWTDEEMAAAYNSGTFSPMGGLALGLHNLEPVYTVTTVNDYAAHINWNDNDDSGNKRPADVAAYQPVVAYQTSEMMEPAPLTDKVLSGWGIAAPADIRTPVMDSASRANYWDYQYLDLPIALQKTEATEDESAPDVTTITVTYAFLWKGDAFDALRSDYDIQDKIGADNTIMGTLLRDVHITNAWKDGGNVLSTRPTVETLVQNLSFEQFYTVLGTEYRTQSGVLAAYYNQSDVLSGTPVVTISGTDGDNWDIIISGLPAYTEDGDPYLLRIMGNGGNAFAIVDGHASAADGAAYTVGYQNTGNQAEIMNACYGGGTIVYTLTDEIVLSFQKQWQDDGKSVTVAARPGGTLYLYRYPKVAERDQANASPITGMEQPLVTNQDIYDIAFTEDHAFPRFDAEGNEYVYVVKEILSGGGMPWEARVENLPKYNSEGVPYHYAVRETVVAEQDGSVTHTVKYNLDGGRYTLSDGQDYAVFTRDERTYGEHPSTDDTPASDEYDITVTNTRAAQKDFTAYVVWKDVIRDASDAAGEYRVRPSIVLVLYQRVNGVLKEVSPRREPVWMTTGTYGAYYWKCEFRDLPRYTEKGEEIQYVVRQGETEMGEYTSLYYAGSPAPVKLALEPQTPTAEDIYLRAITDSDIYKETGVELWTLKADPSRESEGYVPDGGTIVNIRKGQRFLTGQKIWRNLPQGLSAAFFPDVTFRLEIYTDYEDDYAEYYTTGTATIDGGLSSAKTQIMFSNDSTGAAVPFLDKYDAFGILHRYKAREIFNGQEMTPGYKMPVYDEYNLMVINEYETDENLIEKVKVHVTKAWAAYPWTLSPAEYPTATLELWRVMTDGSGRLADSAVAVPVNESAPDGAKKTWSILYSPLHTPENPTPVYTFDGLPKYGYNGYPYEYFLKESLDGCTITGLDTDTYGHADVFQYAVTNTYTGKSTSFIKLSGTVAWEDNNDRFGMRPDETTLRIFRGVGTEEPLLLDGKVSVNWDRKDGNSWTYTVTAADTDAGYPVILPGGASAASLYQYAPNGQPYVYYVESDVLELLGGASITKGAEVSADWYTDDELLVKAAVASGGNVEASVKNTQSTVGVQIATEWKIDEDGAVRALTVSELAMMLPESIAFRVEYWTGSVWAPFADTKGVVVTKVVSKAECMATIGSDGTMTVAVNGLLPAVYYGGIEMVYRLVETHIGTHAITGNTAGGYTVAHDNNSVSHTPTHKVTNTLETVGLSIRIAFYDEDNQDGLRPEEMVFTIIRDGNAEQIVTVTLSGGAAAWADWKLTGVAPYVPRYQADGVTYSSYSVTQQAVEGYTMRSPLDADNLWTKPDPYPTAVSRKVFLFMNDHPVGKMSVTVETCWSDESATDTFGADGVAMVRPNAVTVVLQQRLQNDDNGPEDGWVYKDSVTLTINGNAWTTKTWTELPCRANGVNAGNDGMRLYEYRVVEMSVTGYTPSYAPAVVTEQNANGAPAIQVTNVLDTVSLDVQKEWEDNNSQFARKADVEVQILYKEDGQPWKASGKTLILTSGGEWKGTVTGLPDVSAEGKRFLYDIQETKVGNVTVAANAPYSYSLTEKMRNDDEIILVNALVTRHDITVRKVWDNGSNQDGIHPAVTVQLVKDGGTSSEKMESAIVTLTAPAWSYTWSDLPKYQTDGVTECTYTVVEILPSESPYTASYAVGDDGAARAVCEAISNEDGAYVTITNAYTPKTMDLVVEKAWEDQHDAFAMRPEAVTLRLLRTANPDGVTDAVAVGADIEVDASTPDAWTHLWTNLPVKADNQTLYYSVVVLDADGQPVEKPIIGYAPVADYTTADGSGGTIIASEGKEVAIAGHIDDASGMVHRVKLTSVLETVTVTVRKVWGDYLNIYDSRPDALLFTLQWKTGSEAFTNAALPGAVLPTTIQMDKTATETQTVQFAGLPKYNKIGEAYVYRALETSYRLAGEDTAVAYKEDSDNTAGSFTIGSTRHKYQFTSVTEMVTGGFQTTVTNRLDIETITLTGTKEWADEENKYGIRPDTLTLALYYKDEDHTAWEPVPDGSYTVVWQETDTDIWRYTIANMPKYTLEQATARQYAVVEAVPAGYERTMPLAAAGLYIGGTPDSNGDMEMGVITNGLLTAADLIVRKERDRHPVVNGMAVNSDFVFNVYVSAEEIDADNEGMLYTGGYKVLDSAEALLETRSTADGDITIQGDQSFALVNLPLGFYYSIVEAAHTEYELDKSAPGSTSLAGQLTSDSVVTREVAVNRAVTMLGIENKTENHGVGQNGLANAGGKVTISITGNETPDKTDCDDYQEDRLQVSWIPDLYWHFSDNVTIHYTHFGETQPHSLTIKGYLNANGDVRPRIAWQVESEDGGSLDDFPDIAFALNTEGAIVLTLAADKEDMPSKVWVEVSFVPTLAVNNATMGNVGGEVAVEGGSLSNVSDGVPGDGGAPYRANVVRGIPQDGYVVDGESIYVYNLNDPSGARVRLTPSASVSPLSLKMMGISAVSAVDGRFLVLLDTVVGGVATKVPVSGRVQYVGKTVEIHFDEPLPVPLQVDIQFVPEPIEPDRESGTGGWPMSPPGYNKGKPEDDKVAIGTEPAEENIGDLPKPGEAHDDDSPSDSGSVPVGGASQDSAGQNTGDDLYDVDGDIPIGSGIARLGERPPQTGDVTPVSLVGIAGVLSAVVAVMLRRKKEKRKADAA